MDIRQSYDLLISTLWFPVLVRQYLYIESEPWLIFRCSCYQGKVAVFVVICYMCESSVIQGSPVRTQSVFSEVLTVDTRYSTLYISWTFWYSEHALDTPIAHMGVFCEFEVWLKFQLSRCHTVFDITLCLTTIYQESIIVLCLWWQAMVYLLWIESFVYFFTLSSLCCMQYDAILGCYSLRHSLRHSSNCLRFIMGIPRKIASFWWIRGPGLCYNRIPLYSDEVLSYTVNVMIKLA